MTAKLRETTVHLLGLHESLPYDLLLLADPSREMVDCYVHASDVFVARQNSATVGVIVLQAIAPETVEIKNVAVREELQGHGIGSRLIEHVIQNVVRHKHKRICIGTANSSIGQLYLYQKLGFEISEIRWNYFTNNYAEPIVENGIQAKHMVVLSRLL